MERDGRGGNGKLRAWRHGRLRTCGHDFLNRKAVESLIAYDSVACTFGELCEKVFDQQPLLTGVCFTLTTAIRQFDRNTGPIDLDAPFQANGANDAYALTGRHRISLINMYF